VESVAIDLQRMVALRRCVLALSVIDGVDIYPDDAGALLEDLTVSATPLRLLWQEIDTAVGTLNPDNERARARLRIWLRLRCRLAALPNPKLHARALGLPRRHVLHPGSAWIRHRVPGGAVDLGIGLVGLLDDPDEVVPVPTALLAAAEIDVTTWWPDLAYALEQTARLAADRLSADPRGPLRPFGDFDVVTLLASSAFRAELCNADPLGWRTAAVPMRQRGWLDLGRIDPAFAAAAALATDPSERGFDRAVLVTAEEVVVIRAGGNAAGHALQDPPATVDPWLRRSR